MVVRFGGGGLRDLDRPCGPWIACDDLVNGRLLGITSICTKRAAFGSGVVFDQTVALPFPFPAKFYGRIEAFLVDAGGEICRLIQTSGCAIGLQGAAHRKLPVCVNKVCAHWMVKR